MTDLVSVIWSGPFEAHVGYPPVTAQPGDEILVTPKQAAENPGWYQPLPAAAPARPTVPDPVVVQAETV